MQVAEMDLHPKSEERVVPSGGPAEDRATPATYREPSRLARLLSFRNISAIYSANDGMDAGIASQLIPSVGRTGRRTQPADQRRTSRSHVEFLRGARCGSSLRGSDALGLPGSRDP